jgi:dTDP-4-amino-4,6-dideoxygalactose transaminase
MKIPFLNLALQNNNMRPAIDAAIERVLNSGHFILGDEVEQFEGEFAKFCGIKHAVSVASGTEALQIALLACGVKNGDEVITSAFTAVATVAAIEMAGACPVLVDISPLSFSLNPELVEKAITGKTKAIVPVHLYGYPVDLDAILKIGKENDVPIIEDCAQALGSQYNGKQVGTWGKMGAFSFYPTKNLGAYGDGGAILTDEDELASQIRSVRQYGWDSTRISQQKGVNSRLDELQAAILRAKLPYLQANITRRHELADLYSSLLAGGKIMVPSSCPGALPVVHLFVIRHPRRDALQEYLATHGIETRIHYPVPVHQQKAYLDLGYKKGDFPETCRASQEVLSLPFYPEITDEMVRHVCQTILSFPDA